MFFDKPSSLFRLRPIVSKETTLFQKKLYFMIKTTTCNSVKCNGLLKVKRREVSVQTGVCNGDPRSRSRGGRDESVFQSATAV
jgi:hypothetical protein